MDADWNGDIAFDGESSFTGSNEDDAHGADGSTVSFTVAEPNSGSGSSYTFDVTVTDDEWLTNGDNGSNSINTSITWFT